MTHSQAHSRRTQKRRAPALVAGLFAAAGCASLFAPDASAQTYPTRSVRVVVAAPAGGLTDVVARSISQFLQERLKQSFVVENISGASNTIGATNVARSAADGYTLLVNPSLFIITPLLMKTPYDPVKDFTPVSNVGNVPLAFSIDPRLPMKTVQDFIAAAKAKPDGMSWAIEGIGAVGHLTVERLQSEGGFKLVQVPYRGTAPALIDVIGGRVSAIISPVPNVLQHINAGTLRALAVTTKERVGLLPDVPTMQESGFRGFEIGSWYGVWGPAGMPKDAVAILNREISAAMKTPQVTERLVAQGLVPVGSSSADFAAFIDDEIAKYDKLIKAANIKVGN